MKLIKYLVFISILAALTFSCENKTNSIAKKSIETTKKTPDYKKTEFHIKGMTCEIGCARLIESKLAKTDGVKNVKISFQDSIGMVEFDANKLSQKDLTQVVEKIADGDLYKVTENKIVDEFTILD